jgi:hypothetical protein
VLHVTNGDTAAEAIELAGLPGEVLIWRDVLHEGPVPEGLAPTELRQTRAAFLAAAGWGDRSTIFRDFEARDRRLRAAVESGVDIVLWFERDLFDQLQLLQVLDALGDSVAIRRQVFWIRHLETIATLPVHQLQESLRGRRALPASAFAEARSAWNAFRSAQPTRIERLVASGTPALADASRALRRHLEQFPAPGNGLSRSERQALAELAGSGPQSFGQLFLACQRREEPVFLGDAIFAWYLTEIGRGDRRLVEFEEGEELPASPGLDPSASLDGRRLRLTTLGREVLAGGKDRVALLGLDRWLGGVHLTSATCWRWDPARQQLAAPAGVKA